jgi:hypothetical protein
MLGLCFLVALAVVSLTSPYTNRVVYLLPYLVLAVALLADTALSESLHSTRRTLVMLGLALALVWAPLVTLGSGHYTWGALYRREATSPDRIMEVARQAIGPRAARVYLPLDTFEFYYAGRKLGWKQFLLYDEPTASEKERLELLETMDFVILPEDDPGSVEQGQLLRQHGFSLARRLFASRGKRIEGKPHEPSPYNVHGYGAYLIYARPGPVHN